MVSWIISPEVSGANPKPREQMDCFGENTPRQPTIGIQLTGKAKGLV